jgi:hypothetical protein
MPSFVIEIGPKLNSTSPFVNSKLMINVMMIINISGFKPFMINLIGNLAVFTTVAINKTINIYG